MVIAPLIMVVKAAEVMADMVVLIEEEDTKQKSKLASIASKKLNNISLTPIMI